MAKRPQSRSRGETPGTVAKVSYTIFSTFSVHDVYQEDDQNDDPDSEECARGRRAIHLKEVEAG